MNQTNLADKQKRLGQLEKVITKNIEPLHDAIRAFVEIRKSELYKVKDGGKFQTFEEYYAGLPCFMRSTEPQCQCESRQKAVKKAEAKTTRSTKAVKDIKPRDTKAMDLAIHVDKEVLFNLKRQWRSSNVATCLKFLEWAGNQ
jgi:hypothetical protein